MITVFTPAYNRAYILPALYASLQRQTVKDFEWIVVDDGSSDDTPSLFSAWQKEENDFPIVYVRQENGGKHRAVNHGVKFARGELFLIVDSDDHLVDNAIETVLKWEKNLPEGKKWGGVAGLRVRPNGDPIGTSFQGDFADATSLERDKFRITGDKAEVFYTELLRKFPFPEFEGEKFITENTVWFAIAAEGYRLRWFNEPVIVCEYLEDGLTRNAEDIKKRNPYGYLYSYALCHRVEKGLKKKLAAVFHYYEVASGLGWNKKKICKELKISRFTLWTALFAKKVFGKH